MVNVGDEVRLDTDVLEIETDNATVWFPSTVKGIVMRLYVQPGQYLEFGQPILQVQFNPSLPDLRAESLCPNCGSVPTSNNVLHSQVSDEGTDVWVFLAHCKQCDLKLQRLSTCTPWIPYQ